MMLFDRSGPPDEYIRDPHAFLADVHQHGGMWFNREREMWVVSGFDAISGLLRHPDLELTGASSFSDRSPEFRASLAHQLRVWFKPPFSEDVQVIVTKTVSEAVDAVLEMKAADLVPAFAQRIPMQVMGTLLGVPEPDRLALTRLATSVLRGYDLPWGQRVTPAPGLAQNLIRGYFRDRMTRTSLEDATPLVRVMRESWRSTGLPDDSLHDACGKLITAGVTTTAAILGNILVRLMSLSTEGIPWPPRERLGAWTEEFLRMDSPVLGMYRRAVKDVDINGQLMRKGQLVLLLSASANRDPARIAEPQRFWPDRPNNVHLTFGQGTFYCVGAHLARLEITCVLEALSQHLNRIQSAAPVSRVPGWLIHESHSIPVTISPPAPTDGHQETHRV